MVRWICFQEHKLSLHVASDYNMIVVDCSPNAPVGLTVYYVGMRARAVNYRRGKYNDSTCHAYNRVVRGMGDACTITCSTGRGFLLFKYNSAIRAEYVL